MKKSNVFTIQNVKTAINRDVKNVVLQDIAKALNATGESIYLFK